MMRVATNEDEIHENMKAEIPTRFEWKGKQSSKTFNQKVV